MRVVKWLFLFFSLSLWGCSGYFLGTENLAEPVDLPKITAEVDFIRQWKKTVGKGTDQKALSLTPLATRSTVYAASADGELVAYARESGERLWKVHTGQAIAAGVSGNDQVIVVVSRNGLLMAFDTRQGTMGWRYQLSTEVLAAPLVISDLIVVRAIDGQVVALDARSGQPVWKQDIGVADLSIRGNSKAVFVDGMLLFTNGKGHLTVLSIADGKTVFTAPLVLGKGKTAVDRIADLMATPAVRKGVLFLSAYRHQTLAIDLKDGGVLWQNDLSTALDIFADNRYVYLVDKNSTVYALSQQDGKVVWRNDQLKGRRLSPLSGDGYWLTSTDYDGNLIVMDAGTGAILGITSVGSQRAYVAPRYLPNGWLTYTRDGSLTMTEINAQ